MSPCDCYPQVTGRRGKSSTHFKRHEGSASFAKTNELSVRLTCNSAVALPDAGIGDAIRRPWETRKSCPAQQPRPISK